MCAQVNIIQPSFIEVIPATCHPHPNSLHAFAALMLLAAAPSHVNLYQIHNLSQGYGPWLFINLSACILSKALKAYPPFRAHNHGQRTAAPTKVNQQWYKLDCVP